MTLLDQVKERFADHTEAELAKLKPPVEGELNVSDRSGCPTVWLCGLPSEKRADALLDVIRPHRFVSSKSSFIGEWKVGITIYSQDELERLWSIFGRIWQPYLRLRNGSGP